MSAADRTLPAEVVDQEVRDRLRRFADALIPAGDGMPAASEVGVADRQLDRVLAARPDLAAPLARALADADPADHEGTLERLRAGDLAAHDALLLVVAGGYYTDARVRKLIGYDGQQPVEVRPEIIPNYVEEGLVEPLLARGPIYRPADAPASAPSGENAS
jgi:hypothetical protein